MKYSKEDIRTQVNLISTRLESIRILKNYMYMEMVIHLGAVYKVEKTEHFSYL